MSVFAIVVIVVVNGVAVVVVSIVLLQSCHAKSTSAHPPSFNRELKRKRPISVFKKNIFKLLKFKLADFLSPGNSNDRNSFAKMSKFEGNYRLERNENMDEYFSKVGENSNPFPKQLFGATILSFRGIFKSKEIGSMLDLFFASYIVSVTKQ